jgi:replicative DNA helicase
MTDTDAEAAVIGACLCEQGCIAKVSDFLRPEDFYSEQNRVIYEAMLELWAVGEPVSEMTVTAKLTEHKRLKLAGGASYLSYVATVSWDVTTGGVGHYAEQVKRNSLGRNLKHIGRILEHDDGDPHEVLNGVLERLVNASANSLRSVPQSLGEYTSRVVENSINLYRGEANRRVVKTEMDYFDAITGGLSPADLIIIGAQPSVGKSAFALWIAKKVSEQNLPVLFVSLEMSAEQIATRMLAAESGIKYTKIQEGSLSDMIVDQIKASDKKLRTLPFVVDDRSGQTISDIRTKARREQVRNGLSLLIVDYLQIACKDPTDVGMVAQVSNGLKNIAKDLDIPVIALSQFSRNIDYRESKRPQLTDLKQSSQIEQDADLVFLMYVPDKRKRDELCVFAAKHRNGPLGEVLMHFDKDCQRFNELEGSVG